MKTTRRAEETTTIRGNQYITNINPTLIKNAKANDANALFQISLTTLHYNRIGFARAFLHQAADIGHLLAKKYLNLLTEQKQSISAWQKLILSENGFLSIQNSTRPDVNRRFTALHCSHTSVCMLCCGARKSTVSSSA